MFKQLVNIIVQTFSKGSGLDKVAKDADGKVIPNVPLLVWQIGGGEYTK